MAQVNLRSLLTLLDDPDEGIAVSVMGELLKYDSELLPLLGEFQESENKLQRKRIQQLETIINLRERRKSFLDKLQAEPLNIFECLIELHLIYFDRDTPEILWDMLRTFMSVAENNEIKNLTELGAFMARNGFALPPAEEILDPENFCIGPVLEDRLGSDIMLCTLALLAGIDAGLSLGLVRVAGRFAVIDVSGGMISPANDWLPDKASKLERGDFWNDPKTVIRYASLMLFLHAVCSDNFRYVHTIAHTLTGSGDEKLLDFLPYPYNGKDLSEEKNN